MTAAPLSGPSRVGQLPTLRGYRRFAGIAFRAGPVLTVTAAAATVLAAAAPLAAMVAVGVLVGQIPDVAQSGLDSPGGRAAMTWAIAVGVLFGVQWGLTILQGTAVTALADRVNFVLQRQLMTAAMAPRGIEHLEDAHSLDLITVGRETFRSWLKPGSLATTLSALFSSRFTLTGAAVMLAVYRWPLALAFWCAALWAEYEAQVAARREAEHHHGGTPLARRTDYFYELGVTPGAAKEIRVFGLPTYVLERFSATWALAMHEALGKGSLRTRVAGATLGLVALVSVVWLSVDASSLGLAATVIYAQSIMIGLGTVSEGASARLDSEMALATLRRYEAAVEVAGPAAMPAPSGAAPASRSLQDGIRFEGVVFGYPGGGRDVLRGLDLAVPAGKSLAVIGANGAGKTTLIKLLCGFYQPTAGRILVDGRDLSRLDPAEWRRHVAAVFQDYVRYEMPARTNIGFGSVEFRDDLTGIRVAAAEAGVSGTIERLGVGWDTVLSSDYLDGADLSGGEWQKVALARALFAIRHGASVLILDEPTANLDARAEAQLYERFLALTEGVTTIVISHRFSTVRQAASIAVIRDGLVAEQGSHDELMALAGQYATMFRLQAARFTDYEDAGVAEWAAG